MPIDWISVGVVHRHPLAIAEVTCILKLHPAENATAWR